ncbi:hypothetical protein BD779DRAFT_307825 [Infundibulicybe gibba]|nr:hypothetical protein BD779DRAFT_307825 [Infundibulicybe gibba]
MPGLDAASLAVSAVGVALAPVVASTLGNLKPSANTLTKMTEEQLAEILRQLETYNEIMDQNQVGTMMNSYARHKSQLEALRRQYPDSFQVKQLWNKYVGTYRQRAQELYTKTDALRAHVTKASETARSKNIYMINAQKTPIDLEAQPLLGDLIFMPEPAELSASQNYLEFPGDGISLRHLSLPV